MKPSRRRTDAVVGYVNFPMDRIESTKEGGCFVRLVVLDVADYDERWVPCCGGYQYFNYDECFLGDDQYVSPTTPSEGNDEVDVWKYYPDLYNEVVEGQWQSVRVLAVLTIGATGWSSGEWRCTYADLTPEGKALYDSLQNLYPGREVRLLTYLDT